MRLEESLYYHDKYYTFHNSEFPFKMTLEKEKKEKNDGKLGHKINKSNWYFTQGYAP